MARPSLEPATPSALAPALLRLLRARGADASLLALRFGLSPDAEARDEEPLASSLLGALLEAGAEATGEPYLSLSLPEALPFRRYGAAELSARASPTLRDALAHTARYLPLVVPGLEGSLDEEGAEATFRVRPRAGRPARRHERHVHEYALAHALTSARRETGLALSPAPAFFAHPRPPDLAPLARFFGTHDLGFGAESSGFVLPRAALDAPTRSADPRLLATALDLAEAALASSPQGRTAAALVADRLRALLPDASLEAAAGALKMSPRTLQRRLEQEGTRFAEVLDGVRQGLARGLVKDPTLPLSEIAFRLGFADLATFSRAFKRWTGTPPGAFRRALEPPPSIRGRSRPREILRAILRRRLRPREILRAILRGHVRPRKMLRAILRGHVRPREILRAILRGRSRPRKMLRAILRGHARPAEMARAMGFARPRTSRMARAMVQHGLCESMAWLEPSFRPADAFLAWVDGSIVAANAQKGWLHLSPKAVGDECDGSDPSPRPRGRRAVLVAQRRVACEGRWVGGARGLLPRGGRAMV